MGSEILIKDYIIPFASRLARPLAHGEVGIWDEVLIYGGGILLCTFLVFILLLRSQRKAQAEDAQEPDEKE
jgi:hypothetical protein